MKTVIIIAIAFVLLIPVSSFAESIEDVMSDYKLKGDAYSLYNHPYMAFLNYDKANLQPEKDTNYNKWNEYKIFFESLEENTENYTIQELQDIIEKSNQMGDYQTTIKYSDMAIEKYPTYQHAYNNKIRTLTFMDEYKEAWNTLEKAGIDDAIPIFSGKYTEYKIRLLFAMGNYEGALAFFENWAEYVLSIGGYGLPPGSSTILIAMAYEKLGYSDNAQYWYDQDYLNTSDFDIKCQKAGQLHSLGLYQDVVEIMEKNNAYQNCREVYLYSYIISKDIVTGQYIPPIEHSEEMSFETIELDETSIPINTSPTESVNTADDVYKKICLSPDGYCMERYGMNNPDSYGECLGKWVPYCQTYEEKQNREPYIPVEITITDTVGVASGQTEIVCGEGTVLIDHICQVEQIEEEEEVPVEKVVDSPEEKPSKKSVNWFSSIFDWLGGLFQ